MLTDEKKMSLYGHLDELRTRLTRSAFAVIVGFFVAYGFHMELFDLVVFPVKDALSERGLYRLQALHVTESILVYLKLSFVAGLMGVFPYILSQVWAFIAPGLLESERRYVTPIVLFSTVFFALGVTFSYTVLLPFVTGFLTDLTTGSESITLQLTVENVFSFSLMSLLLFGLVFQLPILMFFLTLLGVVDHRGYLNFYRYFIVLSFIIGALLTPPEPVSQILMALPMNLLYGIGVIIAYLLGQRQINAETGEMAPIGARVWLTVGGILGVFVGGIVGGVWLMQPGPHATNLVPKEATWQAGWHPVHAREFELRDALLSMGRLPADRVSRLSGALENDEANLVLAFGTGPGETGLILHVDDVERADLESVFDTDNPTGPGSTIGGVTPSPVLVALSGEWVFVGAQATAEAALECDENREACLDFTPIVEEAIQNLRTSGPAWGWADATHRDLLPFGQEVEGLQFTSGLLVPGENRELRFALSMVSDAAALAYKTRIDLWRDQNKAEVVKRAESEGMAAELRNLEGALVDLAKSTEETLLLMKELVPEEKQPSLEQVLSGTRKRVAKIQEMTEEDEESEAGMAEASGTGDSVTGIVLSRLDAEQKGKWSVQTRENQVIWNVSPDPDALQHLFPVRP